MIMIILITSVVIIISGISVISVIIIIIISSLSLYIYIYICKGAPWPLLQRVLRGRLMIPMIMITMIVILTNTNK